MLGSAGRKTEVNSEGKASLYKQNIAVRWGNFRGNSWPLARVSEEVRLQTWNLSGGEPSPSRTDLAAKWYPYILNLPPSIFRILWSFTKVSVLQQGKQTIWRVLSVVCALTDTWRPKPSSLQAQGAHPLPHRGSPGLSPFCSYMFGLNICKRDKYA